MVICTIRHGTVATLFSRCAVIRCHLAYLPWRTGKQITKLSTLASSTAVVVGDEAVWTSLSSAVNSRTRSSRCRRLRYCAPFSIFLTSNAVALRNPDSLASLSRTAYHVLARSEAVADDTSVGVKCSPVYTEHSLTKVRSTVCGYGC